MTACGVFNYVLITLEQETKGLEQISLTTCGSVNTPQEVVQACTQNTS